MKNVTVRLGLKLWDAREKPNASRNHGSLKSNFSLFMAHAGDSHLACWPPLAPVWGWALGSSTVAVARARAHTQHSTLIIGLL